MTQDMHDFAHRIERLEKENRRLKRIGGGLAIFLGAVGLMGASTAFCKTVWAERLVLRDSSGRDRLMMDAYSGAPAITMQDEKGRSVARFSWERGVAMEVLNGDGECAARVHMDEQGKVTSSGAKVEKEGDMVGMVTR